MKNIFLAALLTTATLTAAAQNKPAYKDARAVYDEIIKPIASTGIWHQKSLRDRIAAAREGEALEKRAEKVFGENLFGPGGACRSAAIYRRSYIIGMNDMVALIEGRTQAASAVELLGSMRTGVVFGEKKAECYAYVESLDAKH